MPSIAFQDWSAARATALDEIENAHRSVGGAGPGRRYATQQINQAYSVLLSSHFQGFCRNLHSECVDYLVTAVLAAFRNTIMEEFLLHRKRDRGNPNPANLEADFGRLGISFWAELLAADVRNAQ